MDLNQEDLKDLKVSSLWSSGSSRSSFSGQAKCAARHAGTAESFRAAGQRPWGWLVLFFSGETEDLEFVRMTLLAPGPFLREVVIILEGNDEAMHVSHSGIRQIGRTDK